VILGFPADDVAGQEPRSDEQIAEFCEANFGVSFPMFAKSNVVSEPVNPLFERLAAAAGAPSWNFNKYLLDRDGEVVERYDAGTAPDDPALTARLDELLGRG
jgi:glutathione peroxidase